MLAFNVIQPVVDQLVIFINAIHSVVPSYAFDMILLAFLVRLALFPLANQQFKSMAEMQKVQPLIKGLQAKFKGKPQELQAATMALYKEHKVNPLAGCLPMLIQLPILLALYYAVNSELSHFANQSFLWIGSPISLQFPQVFATSLAAMDYPLLLLYIIAQYATVRYGSPPSSDPQQAQTQKIMSIISPLMLAYFGWRYHWPSALLIYWNALSVFTLAQQFYMYSRHGLIGNRQSSLNATPDALASAHKALPAKSTTKTAKSIAARGNAKRKR